MPPSSDTPPRTAPTRGLDHYCGFCRYALDRHREPGQPDRFEHTGSYDNWQGPAHDPEPVPLAEMLDTHMVCDVCSAPDPAFAYRFASMRHLLVNDDGSTKSMDFGEWWMICKDCSPLVDRTDVAGMVQRAKLPLTARGEPADYVAEVLTPIYQMLMLVPPFERIPAREVRW